jgi:hypothetical protein
LKKGLLFVLFAAAATLLHVPALHASRATTTERRVERKVDVLLRINANQERRNVDDLFADADVTLADEHSSVVDALCKTELKDQSLKTTLQNVLWGQGKHVIQLVLILRQESILVHSAEEGFTLEKTAGVLFVEREQVTGTGTNLRQNHLHAPQLALVAETILSDDFQLGI